MLAGAARSAAGDVAQDRLDVLAQRAAARAEAVARREGDLLADDVGGEDVAHELAATSPNVTISVDATAAPRKIFHATLQIPATPGDLTLYYPLFIVALSNWRTKPLDLIAATSRPHPARFARHPFPQAGEG